MKSFAFILQIFILTLALPSAEAQQKSELGIRHSFVVSGPKTLEVGEDDQVTWTYDDGSRDISKLTNGHYLITYNDVIVEVNPKKDVVWKYERESNDEFMSAQRLAGAITLITEQGNDPRLIEVNQSGNITAIIPIQPETDNIHMQSRMARKLANGQYLVPHRLMPFVKEYDGQGNVVKTLRLDTEELGGKDANNGSFRAERLADGGTLVTCASGNRLVLLDASGAVEWQVTTEELDGLLQDVCGLQVLKNGHFMVSCYGNQAPDGIKMMEINREKEIVWTYQNPGIKYVHTLQVLTTNGIPE